MHVPNSLRRAWSVKVDRLWDRCAKNDVTRKLAHCYGDRGIWASYEPRLDPYQFRGLRRWLLSPSFLPRDHVDLRFEVAHVAAD